MARPFVTRLVIGGVAAASLVLAACGTQRPSAAPAATPTAVPAASVSAQTATRGGIQQTLSYSGDIRAREQISVLPKVSGRVERTLVDVGSRVKAGDTLATLDQESVQITALQARASLAGAEAKLASLQAGPKSDDVAAAEAALIQQQVRLQNMLVGGRAEDVQVAQAGLDAQQARLDLMLQGGRPEAVQQAQDALDAANAKLAGLEKGATNDITQAAQSAVDSDKAALASAEAAYTALGGNNAADLQAAQSQVDALTASVAAAQSAVASADAALNNLKGSGPADIQQVQSATDQAQAQLDAAQAALAGGLNEGVSAGLVRAKVANLGILSGPRVHAYANRTSDIQQIGRDSRGGGCKEAALIAEQGEQAEADRSGERERRQPVDPFFDPFFPAAPHEQRDSNQSLPVC